MEKQICAREQSSAINKINGMNLSDHSKIDWLIEAEWGIFASVN